MDPATLATMYAINVGINALGGKRGSTLFKDSFGDTATQALTMHMTGGFDAKGTPGAKQAPIGYDTADMAMTTATDQAFKPTPKPNDPGFFKKGLESFSDVFRMDTPEGRKMDKFKVGATAAGAAGLAYGLGAFDPVPPKEPKYPGYNLFYAQNPSQFMPYDDPNMQVDYSQYPDKPYSGIKAGGIIGLESGGQAAPDLLREEFEKYKKEKDDAGEEAMNFEQFKQFRMQFGQMNQGGITQLAMGGRASNMPMQSIEETTAEEDVDMIPPPMSSIMRPPVMPGMLFAKEGSLVDRLPSKTNTDENDKRNYKRTSGKLVVDAAGKGSEEKDTMLAQLADGEFVTKSKAVRGAGIALGANPKDKKQQRELGARFFYKQMADFDKLAKRMS
tara:strand:+ start:24 stop:1187 length:1164 start_codon:yes stop_codon:yes gene_type:complete